MQLLTQTTRKKFRNGSKTMKKIDGSTSATNTSPAKDVR